MIDNVSTIFETDLRNFIDVLESMETYSMYYIERIKNKYYTEEEISDIFKHIHRQINTLTYILVSMIEKAAQYKPTDIALQNFLNHLGPYLNYMTSKIINATRGYRKNPSYGIRSINKALRDILYYTKTIREELNDAIEKGLFM
jgi:hypothetical protein